MEKPEIRSEHMQVPNVIYVMLLLLVKILSKNTLKQFMKERNLFSVIYVVELCQENLHWVHILLNIIQVE